jgi:hypothetical protein
VTVDNIDLKIDVQKIIFLDSWRKIWFASMHRNMNTRKCHVLLDYGFKNKNKTYRLTYGFSFFVISISGRLEENMVL